MTAAPLPELPQGGPLTDAMAEFFDLPAALLEALPVPTAWQTAQSGRLGGNAAFRSLLGHAALPAWLLAAPDGVHLVRLPGLPGAPSHVYRVRVRRLDLSSLSVYLFEDVQVFYEDSLTGLSDRRALVLDTQGGLLGGSVAMVDIDGFKSVNDTLGHAVGDEVLRTLAGVLRRAETAHGLRAYRLAGDEFVLISGQQMQAFPLPEVQAQFAAACVERGWPPLTLTYGIAHVPRDGRKICELLQGADEQLYRRKLGRPRARERLKLALDRAASEVAPLPGGSLCAPEPERGESGHLGQP